MEVQILMLVVVSFASVLGQFYPCGSQMKVELVQVLFRHGERTPLEEAFATLHYTDSSVYEPFATGFGQLTNNGKRQAYKVGRMLRKRYNGFLNETYKREDIFAQSAELDRIQSSMQLVLAGLYSSDRHSQWNSNLTWSPIPYHFAPERLDVLFRQYKGKKYSQLMEDAINSPAVREKLDSFSDLLEFVNDKEGVAVNGTLYLMSLWSTLMINKRMNISLPSWYSDDLMSRLEQLTVLYLDCMSFTPEMKRVIAGPLVKTFLERMNLDEKIYNPRKMYLYSGSDINVAAVARAFDVDSFRLVDFSSTLILEKLRDSNDQLYVRVLEWDAIKERLINRKMKECDEISPASDFLKICHELIPSDKEMRYLLDDFKGQDVVDLYVNDPLIEEK